MVISARLRWTLYGLAALGTAAAIWSGDPAGSQAPEVVQPTRAASPAAGRVAVDRRRATTVQAGDVLAQRMALSRASSSDPFADDMPAALAAGPVAAQPATPAAATVPAVPALPFTYIGRWQEKGMTVVYLQENGQHVVQVRGPGPLNDRFAVESIADDRMVLRAQPGGRRYTLLLARTEGGGGAQAPAAPGGGNEAAPSQEEN